MDEAEPKAKPGPYLTQTSVLVRYGSGLAKAEAGTAEAGARTCKTEDSSPRSGLARPRLCLGLAVLIDVDREHIVYSTRLFDSSRKCAPLPNPHGYPWLIVWTNLDESIDESRDESRARTSITSRRLT